MRRLAALAVTIALAWLIVSRFHDGAGKSAALGLGLALLAAGIVGWLCQFVRLPKITGYLLLGLICGPSVANIITDPMARDLQTASSLAVVVIGLVAGLQFSLRRTGRARVALLAGVTVTIAWLGLAVGFFVIWPWLPIAPELIGIQRVMVATFAATLLVAGSPAVTVAVVAEGRARGPLADLASEVVVVMQVASLVLLAAWQGLAALLLGVGTPRPRDVLVAGIWSIVGSAAFGTAVGAAFTLYLRHIGRELTLMVFVVCLVLSALTAAFGFEPFIAGLAAGLVVQNVTSELGATLYEGLENAVLPILVLFFAALGASLHIEAVAIIGVIAVGIAAMRVFMLRAAIGVAALITREKSPAVPMLWRALVPTAGATIGLAAAVMALTDWGTRLQAPVLAVVAVTQIIGPIVFRAALGEAGEIGRSTGGLIVVSNREPWVHERLPDGTIHAKSTPGGVSVALDALMRERGGVWIAHGAGSADRDVVDDNNSIEVPPDAAAYRLRRLWLTAQQEEGYYAGFSNSALWPLCHQAHVRPVFNDRDWNAYQEVNAMFASTVLLEARPTSSVFLNDYHLSLVAKYLRNSGMPLRTALFWHIPWPDVDRLRICPWRKEILEGLISNDLVAFQLPRDQRNFLAAVTEELGASVSGDLVHVGDHPVRVVAIPIGADFDRISSILGEESLEAEMRRLRSELKLDGRIVGIGVDRLDYTKGIPERIAAIRRLLQHRPDLAGQFVFLQVGVPSRAEVPGYAEISREIEALTAGINVDFGSGPEDGPIVYLRQGFQLPQLVALYRLADFCIVSSLHDGMNLVAKEFVAARDDLQGVLVLSELAGAAEELAEALIINPYDERGFATAVARAVDMPAWEQRRRMQALRRRVAGRDVLAWASDILDRLERRKGVGFLSG